MSHTDSLSVIDESSVEISSEGYLSTKCVFTGGWVAFGLEALSSSILSVSCAPIEETIDALIDNYNHSIYLFFTHFLSREKKNTAQN